MAIPVLTLDTCQGVQGVGEEVPLGVGEHIEGDVWGLPVGP